MKRSNFIPLVALSGLTAVTFGLNSEAFAKSSFDLRTSTENSVELIACGGGGGGGGLRKREARKEAQAELKRLFEEKNKEKNNNKKK